MKKLLALILALTLALSMGTTALAVVNQSHSTPDDISIDANIKYIYDKNDDMIVPSNYTPGDTIYVAVNSNDPDYNNAGPIKNVSALKNYTLKYRVEEGKKYVNSVKFVTKKDGGTTKAYVAIGTVGAYTNNDDMDIEIELTIFCKNDVTITDDSPVISFSLENATTEASGYTTVNSDAPLVNFDDVDDTDPIELYFDNDVEFHVNAKGQGELYLKYSDDPTGTKYDLDSKYPSADLEYHLWDGTKKTFRRTGQLYLPASSLSNGKAPYLYQISSSGALTQVKAKYDSNEEEYVIDTATLNNYVVSNIALSASGATSDTTPSTPTETPKQPATGSGSSSGSTTSSNATEIANQVAQKIKTAKANGTAKPSVDLTVQNEESISAKDLQAIVTAAKNAGGSVRIIADTVSNSSTQGRLYIVPTSAAAVKNDIKYGVYTNSDNTSSTKNMFEKYYNNNVAVIRLGQSTTYGLPVTIAAKVDLSNLNTKTLRLYSYDRASGKYYAITNSGAWIDTSGFLHFNTTLAGDIIITDKALAAK